MLSHDHKCIFTHIPKTAGKTILSVFGMPEFARDYKQDDRHVVDPYGHKPLLSYANESFFQTYYKFAFVRNPLDRIVSAFVYMNNGGCHEGDRLLRDAHLAKYNGVFAAFVEDLQNVSEIMHFKPQVSFICDRQGKVLVDFIGKFEHLERDVSTVSKRLGLQVRQLPVINRSEHRTYNYYYNDFCEAKIRSFYAEDFETFSYD